MTDHLTDEEQLENLKRLWAEFGSTIVASIAVVLMTYFGWNYWQDQQRLKAESSSAAYEELMVVVSKLKTSEPSEKAALVTTTEHLVKQIKTIDSASHYSVNATLFKAKAAIESADLITAKSELTWALTATEDIGFQQIIRLRLARVLMELKGFDEALTLLAVVAPAGFESEHAEIQGDVLREKGDISAAVTAYEKALEKLDDAPQQKLVIQMKLNDIKLPVAAQEPLA